MIQVPNVTSDPRQQQKVLLPDGSVVEMHLQFLPNCQAWFLDRLIYGTVQINGRQLVTGVNLQQFKNQVPFGIYVLTTDDWEAALQQDFSSGRATLYIMTAAEVAYYTSRLAVLHG